MRFPRTAAASRYAHSPHRSTCASPFCGSGVDLPEHMDKKALAPYVGKTVVLGVRPEETKVV